MSIINDALKKAQASLEKKSKKKPGKDKEQPVVASTQQPKVIKGSVKKKKAWYKTIVALISVFFFIIGILLTILLFLMNESNQTTDSSTTQFRPKLKPVIERTYGKGELVLSGITSIGSKNAAIINNDVYQVGEEVNGFIIESINLKEVVALNLESGERKRLKVKN